MTEQLPGKTRNLTTPSGVPPVDMIPPPSPVSSSYSELRGTMNSVPWFNNYAQNATEYQRYVCPSSYSQTSSSSVMESLYEPIVPRADSQMSMHLNNKSAGNSLQRRSFENRSQAGNTLSKEAEIDELTDLLMNSLRKNEVFFGICNRCGEQVVGEGTGCTAMGQVFHIACFTCRVCDCSLQGRAFFYHVDGKPYCEKDYMTRLEKCCVCGDAVVDRILRANGKPYHPKCFTCVVCFKSLEGIQFTIDAANQIYCIEDFHRKFAPRCSVCEKPIMPELGKEETVRVVALDRSFHVTCYKCEDCGHLLRSEAEGRGCYPLDGHVLCKSCNAKRVRDMKI